MNFFFKLYPLISIFVLPTQMVNSKIISDSLKIEKKDFSLNLFSEIAPFVMVRIGLEARYNGFSMELSSGFGLGAPIPYLLINPGEKGFVNSLFLSHYLIKEGKHLLTVGTGIKTIQSEVYYGSGPVVNNWNYLVKPNILIPIPFLGYDYSSINYSFYFTVKIGPVIIISPDSYRVTNSQTYEIITGPYIWNIYKFNIFCIGAGYRFFLINK